MVKARIMESRRSGEVMVKYIVKYFYTPSNEWERYKRDFGINEAYKMVESQRIAHAKCINDCWYPKWEVEEVDE